MDQYETEQLVQACWHVLHRHAVQAQAEAAASSDSQFGFLVTLDGHDSRREYLAVLRANLNSSDVARVARAQRESPLPILLLTNHVTRKRGELLESAGCDYVDAAGNASLSLPGFRLKVTGERPQKRFGTRQAARAPWPDALIRGAFAILHSGTASGVWQWPLTVTWLADAARLSVGSASKVRRLLVERGYLHRESVHSVHVLDRGRLLRDWLGAYADRYYPRNLLGRVSISDAGVDGMWGAESAAQRLTGGFVSGIGTLYIDEPVARWRFRHAKLLNRAGAGTTVELRSVFWHPQGKTPGVTPPLLVYADLVASGEGRNLEVGEEIYERFLRAVLDEG